MLSPIFPFYIFFFFKISGLTSPPSWELCLLLLQNLAQIISFFFRLTCSCYVEILSSLFPFLLHTSFLWFKVRCLSTWTPYQWILHSFSLLRLPSLHFAPILLLHSFLDCYKQTVKQKLCLFAYITEASTNQIFCNQVRVSVFSREDSDTYMHRKKIRLAPNSHLTPFPEDWATWECKIMKENVCEALGVSSGCTELTGFVPGWLHFPDAISRQ